MKEVQNGKANLYDWEVEKTVIGILTTQPFLHVEIIPMLSKNDFTHGSYKNAFIAMQSLFEKRVTCDLMTLNLELKILGLVTSILDIVKSSERIATGANIERHTLHLVELRIRRELDIITMKANKDCGNITKDVLASIEELTSGLKNLINQSIKNPVIAITEAYDRTVAQINNTESGQDDLLISEFMLPSVNEWAVGKTRGNNTIIAARPGVGKTAMLVQELWNDSLTVPVGLITIEQTTDELMYRMISSQTGIPTSRLLRRKDLSKAEHSLISDLKDHFKKKFFIVDNVKTLPTIRNALIKLFEVYGVEVWGLDYLQLAKHESIYKTKNNSVEEISAELKYLSKDYKKHGLILSQLGRESDKGAEIRKPRMSDLRDSGGIEQDATTILLLYRPEAQGVMKLKDGTDLRGEAIIIIAKNRLGAPSKEVDVKFDGVRYKFYEEEQSQSLLSFNGGEDAPY